jgi:NDP-sugar pyrophosphorylase family protein
MKPYPVAILAGGLATRLRPVTATIPKSLVSVAGEPFLAHQLRLLHSQGVRSAVLCVGHLGEMIEEEFGDAAEWGIELRYSHDGPVLLGTGGALVQALPLLGDAFFVLYGDSYLPVNYAAAAAHFQSAGKRGLMTVFENENAFDRSNVCFRDGEIVRYDKRVQTPEMRHIDYGLSLFRADAFAGRAPREAFDLADLQRELVQAGEMAGHPVRERFYEIGSHEGLAELDALLGKNLLARAG